MLCPSYRVMRRYKFPGVEEVRDEVLLYIYQLVCAKAGTDVRNIKVDFLILYSFVYRVSIYYQSDFVLCF